MECPHTHATSPLPSLFFRYPPSWCLRCHSWSWCDGMFWLVCTPLLLPFDLRFVVRLAYACHRLGFAPFHVHVALPPPSAAFLRSQPATSCFHLLQAVLHHCPKAFGKPAIHARVSYLGVVHVAASAAHAAAYCSSLLDPSPWRPCLPPFFTQYMSRRF